jgi:hypothetical protein
MFPEEGLQRRGQRREAVAQSRQRTLDKTNGAPMRKGAQQPRAAGEGVRGALTGESVRR